MNGRLYGVAATLTDEERRRDLGAFFRSVHGTLNHILLTDRVWLGRFLGYDYAGVPIRSLDQELYADFAELRAQRERTDADIVAGIAVLAGSDVDQKLRYRRMSAPGEAELPLWLAVTHFFNHQTHHRGQVTTLLKQLGREPGVTDMPRMFEGA